MDDPNSRQEINKYRKFRKVDGAAYRKVNAFLRKRTYITAREWALARLCTDFRTSGGAEMTFIGQHLPELVPFMKEPYSLHTIWTPTVACAIATPAGWRKKYINGLKQPMENLVFQIQGGCESLTKES